MYRGLGVFVPHALQAADVEARIMEEESLKREKAAEMARDARLKKIKFMTDMDDGKEVSPCLPYTCAIPQPN